MGRTWCLLPLRQTNEYCWSTGPHPSTSSYQSIVWRLVKRCSCQKRSIQQEMAGDFSENWILLDTPSVRRLLPLELYTEQLGSSLRREASCLVLFFFGVYWESFLHSKLSGSVLAIDAFTHGTSSCTPLFRVSASHGLKCRITSWQLCETSRSRCWG